MVTSCPTNPHYQSGCNFLRSRHCCRSCHQSHLQKEKCSHRSIAQQWNCINQSKSFSQLEPLKDFMILMPWISNLLFNHVFVSLNLNKTHVTIGKRVHTSTKATVSCMASTITTCAVVAEASRAARGLTVVSRSKPTWKPETGGTQNAIKRCISPHY